MISSSQIQALSQQIADRFRPEKILLFGSYAYGAPTEDSDVDLLVIMSGVENSVYQAIAIRRQVNPGFAMDLMVRTPEQIADRLALGDFFIQEILEKGRVLYEVNYARVG
jgi:uncharacterized protein